MLETLPERSLQEKLLSQPKTEDVVNELIVLNYGLLNRQLGKFRLFNDPDALSFAYEALYNAILTFDDTKQIKFSTYATVCIYNRLGSYIRSLHNNKLDVISYDIAVLEDGESLLEVLDSGERTDAEVIMNDTIIEALLIVDDVIHTLNPLQKKIAQAWRLGNFTITHEEVAAQVGCTQSYVSQVIKKVNQKVKHKLEVANNEQY